MQNGNYGNGPEFGWEYSHGGNGGQGQNGMSSYSQNQGGRQWLHSNHGSFASTPDPFSDYNNSMISKYGNYSPSSMGGKNEMLGSSMVHGGGREMSNGMGGGMGRGMGQGMGQDMGFGMGGEMPAPPRMRGGFAGRRDPVGRHNGLGDLGAARGRNNGTSWF